MGFREKIGLKPKASTVNLSSAMNNGLGVGAGGAQHQPMYSIPETGYASTAQQARQQQQPRTMGMGGLGNNVPFASRLAPGGGGASQTSFEGNRSASSGSAYSYTAGSTSTASFATTNTSNTSSTHSSFGHGHSHSSGGLGAGLRNFSGTSSKSNMSSKTAQQGNPNAAAQQYQPKEPTITAADVRRCTKLLRQMFELHLELWTLTYTHGTDQYRRDQKRLQVEAILVDIHHIVGAWHAMPPSTWSPEEYEEIKWIVSTLADLPPPPY